MSIAKSWKSDDFYDRTNYFHIPFSLSCGRKKGDFSDGRNYSFALFILVRVNSVIVNVLIHGVGLYEKFVRNLERHFPQKFVTMGKTIEIKNTEVNSST